MVVRKPGLEPPTLKLSVIKALERKISCKANAQKPTLGEKGVRCVDFLDAFWQMRFINL